MDSFLNRDYADAKRSQELEEQEKAKDKRMNEIMQKNQEKIQQEKNEVNWLKKQPWYKNK